MNQIIKPLNKTVMMEDHDRAYYAWKELGIKNRILVHIDAHIDLDWLPDIDLSEIEITNHQELDELLKHQPLWNPFNKERHKMVDIGNYIYPALKEDIVKRFYWIVPDSSWQSKRGLRYIKNTLQKLLKVKKYAHKDLEINKDYFRCQIFNKDIFVLGLSNLKVIEEPVLLDIDVDFLLTQFIWDGTNADRVPWILPEELATSLASKLTNVDTVTIAYSVEGGFTPLRYKYLGDQLYLLFNQTLGEQERSTIQNKINASSNFNLCLFYLDGKRPDFEKAKFHYQKALKIDKSYSTLYNNHGIIYLQKGKIKKAHREYQKFLNLDEKNTHVLTGLGYVALRQKRYKKAEDFFNQSLGINKGYLGAILGKAISYYKTKNLKEAEEFFLKAEEISLYSPDIYWWLGRICEKKGQLTRAIDFYKQAVLSGGDGLLIHLLLFRLYFIKRFYFRAFEEIKRYFYLLKRHYRR